MEQTIQLADYIQQCLDQGMQHHEISYRLLQRGWLQDAIDDAYRYIHQIHLVQQQPQQMAQEQEIVVNRPVAAEPVARQEKVKSHPIRTGIIWIVAPFLIMGIAYGTGLAMKSSSFIYNASVLAIFVGAGILPICLVIGIIKLIRR